MDQVAIPETYFIRAIRLQYSDPDTAIVREVLQNSIDAGARKIELKTGDNWFEVSDDGRGMTPERMRSALLTMGGTDKSGADSVGGFGEAKNLLLFSHANYFIHSLDTVVHGKVLNYEMATGERREGTVIRIEFHPEYGYNQQNFINSARQVMAASNFKCDVTINGATVEGLPQGRTFRNLSWCSVQSRKLDGGTTYYAQVRAGGLAMFTHYIGESKKAVVIEVTAPSKDVFTTNRDRFNRKCQEEIQEIINLMIVDKTSFDRKTNSRQVFRGRQRSFTDLIKERPMLAQLHGVHEQVGEALVRAFENARFFVKEARESGTRATPEQVEQFVVSESYGLSTPAEQEAVVKAAGEVAALVCSYDVDFLVHMENTKYRQIPARFNPLTMSQRPRFLAQLWKHCLKLVMVANDLEMQFKIGWVLNDQERAIFDTSETEPAILLNPDHPTLGDMKTKRALFNGLLLLAAHEVTHHFVRYHDEEFCLKNEEILRKTLGTVQSWRKHVALAKLEII